MVKTLLVILMVGFTFANSIFYTVVSHISSHQSVGVIIDKQVYLLEAQKESTLLFSGKAPIAHSGYKYCVVENNKIVDQETFERAQVINDTLNEHYNRPWNTLDLAQLPTILDPLPIIQHTDSNLHMDGQIPTIHIIGNQSELDYLHKHPELENYKVSVHMTYISPDDLQSFNNLTISISGYASRRASKLSYKLKIKNDSLYGYRHIKLRSIALDNSYMKEMLAYDIAEKFGLPSARYSYTRLYINDQPIGLFGLTEILKDTWIKNEFGNNNASLGALWVADVNKGVPPGTKLKNSSPDFQDTGSDLTFIGEDLTLYENAYSLKEKPFVGEANFTRIKELTKFVARQETDINLWEQYLDVESALRELALEFVISDLDGYLSHANNYILYDDLVNNRIVMSCQDFDVSMGIIPNLSISGDYNEFNGFNRRPLSVALMKVPNYKKRYEELIYILTSKLVNPKILNSRIDQISNMIFQDVLWDQSLPRVGSPNIVGTVVPFETAVNGTGDTSLLSSNFPNTNITIQSLYLKQWLQLHSQAIFDSLKN